MTVGHWEWNDRGVIVKLLLFLEGLGHDQPQLQTDKRRNPGAAKPQGRQVSRSRSTCWRFQ